MEEGLASPAPTAPAQAQVEAQVSPVLSPPSPLSPSSLSPLKSPEALSPQVDVETTNVETAPVFVATFPEESSAAPAPILAAAPPPTNTMQSDGGPDAGEALAAGVAALDMGDGGNTQAPASAPRWGSTPGGWTGEWSGIPPAHKPQMLTWFKGMMRRQLEGVLYEDTAEEGTAEGTAQGIVNSGGNSTQLRVKCQQRYKGGQGRLRFQFRNASPIGEASETVIALIGIEFKPPRPPSGVGATDSSTTKITAVRDGAGAIADRVNGGSVVSKGCNSCLRWQLQGFVMDQAAQTATNLAAANAGSSAQEVLIIPPGGSITQQLAVQFLAPFVHPPELRLRFVRGTRAAVVGVAAAGVAAVGVAADGVGVAADGAPSSEIVWDATPCEYKLLLPVATICFLQPMSAQPASAAGGGMQMSNGAFEGYIASMVPVGSTEEEPILEPSAPLAPVLSPLDRPIGWSTPSAAVEGGASVGDASGGDAMMWVGTFRVRHQVRQTVQTVQTATGAAGAEQGWLEREQVATMLRDFGFHILEEEEEEEVQHPPGTGGGGESGGGSAEWTSFPSGDEEGQQKEDTAGAGTEAGAGAGAGVAGGAGGAAAGKADEPMAEKSVRVEVRAAADILIRTNDTVADGTPDAAGAGGGTAGSTVLRCLVWVEQRKGGEYALLVWCSKPDSADISTNTDAPTALLTGVRNAVSLQLSA
jgi:hypothetical protein